jgi:hypothetical protein
VVFLIICIVHRRRLCGPCRSWSRTRITARSQVQNISLPISFRARWRLYRAMSAPAHPLPQTHFYSVEYPGYVQPSSIPQAVRTLGGISAVESAFKRTANKAETILELSLRPGNPFAHPIAGDVVPTNNILVRVVKRKRRNRFGNPEQVGGYTVEAMGVMPKTVRFRSWYQACGPIPSRLSALWQAWWTISISLI